MPQLPSSSALSEASPDSISELFSRDPESLSFDTDVDKIISILRQQRERNMAAEAAGTKAPRPAKMPKAIPLIDEDNLRI